MPKVTLPDGRVVHFPYDMPLEQVEAEAARLSKVAPPPVERTWGDTALDVGIGAAKGAANTVLGLGELVHKIPGVTAGVDALYQRPGLSDAAFKVGRQEMTPTNTPQRVGSGLETAAEIGLPMVKGAMVAKAAIPTMERAGLAFQDVMGAAKSVPINVEGPGQVALRISQLAERGGTMPKVVRDFLKRVTDPAKPQMVYEEARDFATNIGRLSADEMQRLTPVLKKEVGRLRVTLDDAIQGAAKQVGKQSQYQGAMKEYRQAATLREVARKGKKYALTAGIGAAGYQAAKIAGLVD